MKQIPSPTLPALLPSFRRYAVKRLTHDHGYYPMHCDVFEKEMGKICQWSGVAVVQQGCKGVPMLIVAWISYNGKNGKGRNEWNSEREGEGLRMKHLWGNTAGCSLKLNTHVFLYDWSFCCPFSNIQQSNGTYNYYVCMSCLGGKCANHSARPGDGVDRLPAHVSALQSLIHESLGSWHSLDHCESSAAWNILGDSGAVDIRVYHLAGVRARATWNSHVPGRTVDPKGHSPTAR